jgi:hypothetical protein
MFVRREDLLNVFMTDGELNEIYNTLNSFGESATITEWGSGGSTVSWLFNLNPNQKLVSIEHDKTWFDKVTKIIEDNKSKVFYNNFKYFFIPKTSHIGSLVGQFDYDEGCDNYCNGPQDIDVFNSDVYYVDGLCRKMCIETIFKKAKKRSAVIYLHDYSSSKDKYETLLSLFPRHQVMDLKTSNANNLMLKFWLE